MNCVTLNKNKEMENVNGLSSVLTELVGFLVIPAIVALVYLSYNWCKRLQDAYEIEDLDSFEGDLERRLRIYSLMLNYIEEKRQSGTNLPSGYCSLLRHISTFWKVKTPDVEELHELVFIAKAHENYAGSSWVYWFNTADWEVRTQVLLQTIKYTENLLKLED